MQVDMKQLTHSELEYGENQIMKEGWTYSFGTYFPRNHREHRDSMWSRSVIKAKRGCEAEINYFGKIMARFLEAWLPSMNQYVITHVPAEPSVIRYLFHEMGECASRRLATVIFRQIQNRERVSLEHLLVVAKSKKKRQRQCKGDAERYRNVTGCYRVRQQALVKDRNIVVIDDVITSGATMAECKKVLEKAGAGSVTGIALARTVHKAWWPYQAEAVTA